MWTHRRWLGLVLVAIATLLVAAACDSSDDEERLAAQRLFRNVLIQADGSAAADVRIQGLVDELPPDFPLAENLTLLGSAFTDTDSDRELIVGWESSSHADDLFEFYSEALDTEPWSIVRDPRIAGIDFIEFRDADNPAFRGELRIAQEASEAVVILIVRERVTSGTGSAAP